MRGFDLLRLAMRRDMAGFKSSLRPLGVSELRSSDRPLQFLSLRCFGRGQNDFETALPVGVYIYVHRVNLFILGFLHETPCGCAASPDQPG